MEAMKVILASVDYPGRDETLDYVLSDEVVVSGAREIEVMEAQRAQSGKFIG
jgi:hypothetical protein